MFRHTLPRIHYEHVSIAFAIIFSVVLQNSTKNTTNCQIVYVDPLSIITDVSCDHELSAYVLQTDKHCC